MNKTIALILTFACTAVLCCGCKGKNSEERLTSAYDVSKRNPVISSDASSDITESGSVSSENSSSSIKTAPRQTSAEPHEVYEEVKAGGKAEDMDAPESQNSSNSETSQEHNSSEESKSSSEESKNSSGEDKTTGDDKASGNGETSEIDSNKDQLSGWSKWY